VKALFVQHDHVTSSGPIADRLRHHGFEVDEILVVDAGNFRTPNVRFDFPDLAEYDLVVPLGAPWGAWDDESIGQWLTSEVEWLRQAVLADVPVLGVCFGGQLLSRALGGTVGPAPKAEIGWTPVHSDDQSLIGPGPWFQFHYDRWTLPAGATELARNAAASQAFSFGRSLAVQFHPELDADTLQGWLTEGGATKVIADGQDPVALLAHTRAEEGAARERTYALVDAFLERIAMLGPAPSLTDR